MQDEFANREEEEKLLKYLAAKIRKLRLRAGITQRAFFNQTNIHIGRIETGKVNISIGTLSRICNYFNVTIQEFFEEFPDDRQPPGLSP